MCWYFIICFCSGFYCPVWGSIAGYRVESQTGGSRGLEFDEYYMPQFVSGSTARLRLYGQLTDGAELAFTQNKASCHYLRGKPEKIKVDGPGTGVVSVNIPENIGHSAVLYVCLKEMGGEWIHQGDRKALSVAVYSPLFPFWAEMLVIIFCVMMSSLFNGLCLGLIALDVTDLRVIASCGTEHERGNARKILPVRQKGNELLCSILLTSTLANAVFTVLVDDHVEGWVAAIVSTLIIVIFVEIIPCSVVSRYGMIIGAKTIWLTKGVMILTFPLSFTLGRILNRILGKEISMYTKDRIKELVKITSSYTKMEKQEVDIISGALELSTKSAKEVMTPIEDTFMLPLDGRLDFETISNIVRSGYSRIPIYDGSRSNIVSLLFTKDLAILDPDDRTEIKTIVNFYNHECLFVQEDTMLNNMFVVFKEGKMGHLGIVYSTEYIMNNQRYYDATGIVTLEDVLEEVIKSEIVDETDDVLDNRSKKKSSMVRRRQMTHCLDLFLQDNEKSNVCISPQLRMAALQFLSSGVEPFHPSLLSLTVLTKLLRNKNIYFITSRGLKTQPTIIFPQPSGEPCLVLILEGRVRITLNSENIQFDGGSFMYFGTPSMKEEVDSNYTYDYKVEALGEVRYLIIPRQMYLDARRASEYEVTKFQPNLDLEEYPELFKETDHVEEFMLL